MTITCVLYEAFIQWSMGAKMSGATTNCGKDVVKGCSLLDIPVHVRCLPRRFHAGMRQAFQLPKLVALLARCRRLVAYFPPCTVARYMLSEKQKQQRKPNCLQLSSRVFLGRVCP